VPILRPVPTVSPQQLAAGEKSLVLELAWSAMSSAFSGGVILVAFALGLGATPVQVGLLAAIPFLAQALQLPATVLIERVRQRRLIAVLTITAARAALLLLAALPLLPDKTTALTLLIALQVGIASLNAVGGCAINSWLHQLIPGERLGGFFSRRLFSGTTLACLGTLAAGWLVERAPPDQPLRAYAAAFVLAALAGFASSYYMARAPEPMMDRGGPPAPMGERLWRPFRDRNFRHLLVFLASWTVASNIAAPFLTVYLIEQRGYPVGTVTSLWVTSQLANALTLYLWGRLSDRLSNKGVLAVALPVYFACMLALVGIDLVQDSKWQLGLLYAVHFVLGIATGGIGLATGNLGLKLAPQGQGTVYLAAIGLASACAGGVAPIVAGLLAEAFQASELTAMLRWTAPGAWHEVFLVSFAHWEFLFAISAVLGLYVMHALSRVQEGREVSERLVVQEFALEALRSLNNLSSIGGTLGNLFAFDRLSERRKWWRVRAARPAASERAALRVEQL
jgi:MFS family permease